MHTLLHWVPPTLQQATAIPMPPLETPGHSWASLGQFLVGSLLLSPGSQCTQGFICALQDSVFQSCITSGGSLVGLIATSSKRAYAISRSIALGAPVAGHCWPIPPQETLRHSSGSVFVGGKTRALTRWTFVGKVMSLVFNMLSRLVIAFLPRRSIF